MKACEPLAPPCGEDPAFSFPFLRCLESRFKSQSLTCCFWDGSRKMRRSSAGRSDCTRYSEEETQACV